MQDVVLFETLPLKQGKLLGVVTLNVEATLNSLNLEMIELLQEKLFLWRDEDNIAAVFFQGAGDKAFCAGGDIQALYHSMLEHPGGPVLYAETFFEKEYRLDYLIHTFPKPTICWAHGIVMGGGLGIMGACDIRIGTERTRIAMPEITIGLFPDAGASWLFSRMEKHWAHFLAWTGCAVNGQDAMQLGFVNRLLHHKLKLKFLEGLSQEDWSNDAIDHVIEKLSVSDEVFPEASLPKYENAVKNTLNESLASDNPVAAFLGKLGELRSLDVDDKWMNRACDSFTKGTPTTAQIIERQFRITRNMSLKDMLKIELTIAVQCARHPDFVEGVRALLIEKDNKPQWHYSEMGTVPEAWIDEHFTLPWQNHPLDDLTE